MRARSIVIALIIAALPVGFMYRTLALGQPLARDDASLMVYPIFHAMDRQLAQGSLYLWDASQWCGLPALGTGQCLSLYAPAVALHAALPWMTALHIGYWLHLAAALTGGFWVARNLGASRAGAVVAGCAYAFSGFAAAHLIHFNLIVASAWVPLMLAALQAALARNSPRWWALLAAVSAAGFAGSHPQIFMMAVTVCLLWLVFGHNWRADDTPVRRQVLPLLLAMVVAVLLAAPQLLPTLELATAQGRVASADVQSAVERIASYAFEPRDLVRVLLPSFHGTVHSNILGGGPAWHETNPFTGAAPLLLGIAGAIVAFRRRGWGFCVAIFVVGAALMPGEGNPIHAALARLPFWGSFRATGRWMVLPILSLSLLSALAITYLPETARRLRAAAAKTIAIVAGLIVTVTTILWVVFGVDEEGRLWLPGQGGDFPLEVTGDAILNCVTSWEPVLLVVAAIVTWIVVTRLSSGNPAGAFTVAALVLAVTAPQWYLWQQTNLTVPREFYAEPPATVAEVGEGRIAAIPPALVTPQWQPPGDTWRERMMAERALLTPALGTVWDVDYAGGYLQGLVTPATQAVWEASRFYAVQTIRGDADLSAWAVERYGTSSQRMKRMHRLAGVRQIVTTGSPQDPDLELTHDGLTGVYSYTRPHPRWWLAREAVTIADPEAQLEAAKRLSFDPDRQVIVDRDVALEADPDADAGGVSLLAEGPGRLVLRADCPGPRVLVVADAWYPGWRVSVNGRPAQLLRANYAFRGVALAAGEHTVAFSFRPAAWDVALPMFVVGLLALVALVAWPHGQPPREGLTPPGTRED